MFRRAGPADAASVAALHADSWRRHYRGSYPDDYLDGPVFEERLAVWSERLSGPDGHGVTIVADDGGSLVGFVHLVLDADPEWGALVDNLHVRHDQQGSGFGTALLALAAAEVVACRPSSGLYLWVLEANMAAQAFYRARGARFEGTLVRASPAGNPLVALRCAWPDPSVLAKDVPDGVTLTGDER